MEHPCRGIIVDWAGVLTTPLRTTIETWITAEGIDAAHYFEVMRSWAGGAYAAAGTNGDPIRALERGELAPEHFERQFAAELRRDDGGAVVAEGLLQRMFGGFTPEVEMYDLLRAARAQGLRTCLLSNSWGNSYPRTELNAVLDTLVISGEVGMRKPDAEIFHYTLDKIGLSAPECVFIDDMRPNIEAAQELGIPAILHRDPTSTRHALHHTHGLHALA